jgi:hypothetical protein
MSDLDERLARWKAQTATLQTPPELKERLKQTTSSSAAAKGALSGAVKAGGLVVLTLVVAAGLRFWPRHADVDKAVAPVSVSAELAPPSAVGADPVHADTPIAAVPGAAPVAPSQAIAPPEPVRDAGALAAEPAMPRVLGPVPVQTIRLRPPGVPAKDPGSRPLP